MTSLRDLPQPIPDQFLTQSGDDAIEPIARPFRVGEELPQLLQIEDLLRVLRISRSQFHRLLRAGQLDRFELLPRLGRRAWSGRLVSNYLACEGGRASRFVHPAPAAKRRTA